MSIFFSSSSESQKKKKKIYDCNIRSIWWNLLQLNFKKKKTNEQEKMKILKLSRQFFEKVI